VKRQQLQDEMLRDVVGGGTVHPMPWIVFMAGAMGAGKGSTLDWMSNHGYFPLPDIVQIDLDRFRTCLPEWPEYLNRNAQTAGYLTQRESGYCVEVAQEAAMQAGKNICVDGSLRDHKWYAEVFSSIRKTHANYRIAIIHVKASWGNITARAASRAAETGRIVPLETLRDSFDQVPISVEKLAPLVDFVAHIDNDCEPKLVGVCKRGVNGMAPHCWSEVRERFAKLPELNLSESSLCHDWIQDKLKTFSVIVFSKTYCSYGKKVQRILTEQGTDPCVIHLDEMGPHGVAIHLELTRMTGMNTVPQVFIHGHFVGGYTETSEMLAAQNDDGTQKMLRMASQKHRMHSQLTSKLGINDTDSHS